MHYILDLAVIAIPILFIFLGYRRGIIRTAVEFCGLFASIAVAITVGNMLADWIFESLIRGRLLSSIESVIAETTGEGATLQLEKLIEALPAFLKGQLLTPGISAEITAAIGKGASEGALWIVDELAAPIVIGLIRVILAIIFTVLLLILVKLLAKSVDLIAKLPVIRQLNGLLGMVAGAIKGAAIVLIVLAALRAAIPMMQQTPGILSEESLEKTLVFQTVYEQNPLYELFQPK